ncbi:bifunctional diaminohydroxyphosphoribosylaminopyrimidine deaminase/5-amino-6-(5-phosphoribosylamino)uracil reductase RibD [Profundibacter sp.]
MGQRTKPQKYADLPAQVILAAFRRSLQCAARFSGATSPNPPVGCVILDKQGNLLAKAAHQKAGDLHAEALAIEHCRTNGVVEHIHTVVVTLEPCNHTGRTQPCTEAILGTPAQAVWIGAHDPNMDVRGNGADKLAANGLSVFFIEQLDAPDAALLAQSTKRLIAPFAKHARTGLPWVTVKQAINRSGSMIPEIGKKTFTSQRSLTFAHQLRKRADAIVTGSGTILADQPKFTVRHVADFEGKCRHLVILDRRGRVSDSYLADAHKAGFTAWIETSLEDALVRLGQAGVLEVLVEAGPTLLDMVLASNFWDEHITISQMADPKAQDNITFRYPTDSNLKFSGKEQHVLWNY